MSEKIDTTSAPMSAEALRMSILQKEMEKMDVERKAREAEEKKLQAQLANPDFATRAPAEKVQQAENRIREIQLHVNALDQSIENLQ